MSFELEPHPERPEGINVSKTHPLADFAYLVAGVVGGIAIILFLLQLLAGFLVGYISFEAEKALLDKLAPDTFFQEASVEHADKTAYLQSLADRLSAHMPLPEEMSIHVHYDPGDVANAYATLGGNVVIYQGLIDEVSSENGLAMVVAHEIAHIRNRDPIMSLGRGVVTVMALTLMSGMADSSTAANILNLTGTSLLSKYSRDQESAADQAAMDAMLALYGHLKGADEFFSNMMEEESTIGMEFFSTHPNTEERVERINELGQLRAAELTALPEVLLAE